MKFWLRKRNCDDVYVHIWSKLSSSTVLKIIHGDFLHLFLLRYRFSHLLIGLLRCVTTPVVHSQLTVWVNNTIVNIHRWTRAFLIVLRYLMLRYSKIQFCFFRSCCSLSRFSRIRYRQSLILQLGRSPNPPPSHPPKNYEWRIEWGVGGSSSPLEASVHRLTLPTPFLFGAIPQFHGVLRCRAFNLATRYQRDIVKKSANALHCLHIMIP